MVISCHFTASLDHLHEMLAFILNHAQQGGFTGDSLTQIELAAEEALVNVISYGQTESVRISCGLMVDKHIKIVIQDSGVPFNPIAKVQGFDPEATIRRGEEGGFGIFLMTKMMDKVDYVRDGECNVLTLYKKCP